MGIFFDDWQACLRAHYVYVVRTGDTITEATLRDVLLHSGVSEDELTMLRAQAEVPDAMDPAAPIEAVPAPDMDAALAAAGAGDTDGPDTAYAGGDTALAGENGSPDADSFDTYSDDADNLIDDQPDEEPPISPNQLSLF